MITDFLTHSDIDDSLDPAARQRHELWLHTADVNQLRRRVEDLEARNTTLSQAGQLVVAQFAGIGDDKWPTRGMQLAVERLAAVLEAGG